MKITEWLSKIADFVNLGKLVVNTAAGTVLAIALAIFAADVNDLPILTAPVKGSAYQERLDSLKTEIKEQSKNFEAEAEAEVEAAAEAVAAEARLERLKQALNDLESELRRRDKESVLSGSQLPSRIVETSEDLDEAENGYSAAAAKLEAAKLRKAEEESFLKELYERRNIVRSEEVNTLSALFTLSINHLVALLLLGWLLGTIINPITYTFFLSETRFTALLWRWLRGSPKPTPAEDSADIWQRYLEKGPEELRRTDALALVNYYPPSYFVGLNIVSQTEIDELVAKYFRWLELASQLILPLVALIAVFLWTRGLPWLEVWVATGLAWLAVGLLLLLLKFRRTMAADKEALKKRFDEIDVASFGADEGRDLGERKRLLDSLPVSFKVPSLERGLRQLAHVDPSLSSAYRKELPEVRSVAPRLTRDYRDLLHEEEEPGWWRLIFVAVPAVAWLWWWLRAPAWRCHQHDPEAALLLVSTAVLCWSVVWLLHRLVRDRWRAYEIRKRSLIEARVLDHIRAAKEAKQQNLGLVQSLTRQIDRLKELLDKWWRI